MQARAQFLQALSDLEGTIQGLCDRKECPAYTKEERAVIFNEINYLRGLIDGVDLIRNAPPSEIKESFYSHAAKMTKLHNGRLVTRFVSAAA